MHVHAHTNKSAEEVSGTIDSLWLNDQNLPKSGCLAGINFFSPSPPPTILPPRLSLLLSSALCMQVLSPTEPRADSCQRDDSDV